MTEAGQESTAGVYLEQVSASETSLSTWKRTDLS